MKLNILIYTFILCFLITQTSYAQRTLSSNPEREIIVQFTDDLLTHKNDAASGRLSDFNINSDLLKHNLDSVGVEEIGNLFPKFNKEGRFFETKNGKLITLSDWSNTMILRLPVNSSREKFINRLNQLPEVVYAEANVQGSSEVLYDFREENITEIKTGRFMPFTPNDQHFNRQWSLKNTGTSIQGSGTPDADIDADLAWDITTGSSSIKIAIIDQGVQNDHPEFNGKITGYPAFFSNHGTMVAGIAAAYGNNSAGIAGVAYNSNIVDVWTGFESASDLASAVIEASQQSAHVLNASWGIKNYSITLRRAIRDAYLLNQVFITSAGNSEGHKYPQQIRDGVITVSGTTNTDVKYSNSSTGNWVDVAAPAGEFSEQNDRIYSTLPGGNYGYSGVGTSYSAPHVSGIAALLLSVNPNLYNDDIENLIEISAEDKGDSGFDNLYGHGRVNAHEALKLLQSPYVMNYESTTGGSVYSISNKFFLLTYDVNGLSNGLQYYARRVEVRKSISFSYMEEPNVWCRGVESTGWTKEEDDGGAKRNFGQGFCEVVPGTITNTGATLRTYVYDISSINGLGQEGNFIGTFPTLEANVEFAYTVHGIPGTPPLNGSISGPTIIETSTPTTWYANATGGIPPYSYEWESQVSGSSNWVFLNSGSSTTQTYSFPQQFYLRLKVTDSNSDIDYAIQQVIVNDQSGGGCGDPTLPCKRLSKPTEFSLSNNYPNPFNPTTQLKYTLPEDSDVSIKVFNLMGQEVATLLNSSIRVGFHELEFDASSLSSGIYFARIDAIGNSGNVFSKTIKMQLVK